MFDAATIDSTFAVIVADDDDDVREALGNLVDAHPSLTLVGSAPNGFEAARLCRKQQPQLAVVDVMMPGGGVDAIRSIHAASPATIIAAYTARSDRRTCEQLLAAGAAKVFAKGGAIDLATELHRLVLATD